MKPLKEERKLIPTDEIRQALRPARPGVRLEERRGVWVHSFICNVCGLHFNLYSWKPNRHKTSTITCPECGQREGQFLHFRVCLSRSKRFTRDPGREIFGHCPHPNAEPMDDSTLDGRVP